jgi:Arc/MetJ-type ribon-helix-helix transcriptional regulator
MGRSAFIRAAVRLYLSAKERRELEARLVRAYDGEADAMLGEVADYLFTSRPSDASTLATLPAIWPERPR